MRSMLDTRFFKCSSTNLMVLRQNSRPYYVSACNCLNLSIGSYLSRIWGAPPKSPRTSNLAVAVERNTFVLSAARRYHDPLLRSIMKKKKVYENTKRKCNCAAKNFISSFLKFFKNFILWRGTDHVKIYVSRSENQKSKFSNKEILTIFDVFHQVLSFYELSVAEENSTYPIKRQWILLVFRLRYTSS